MFKYYIKIGYRNFINQRPYSFLNLIGLSIGLCIAFIALLYVTEETGYDAHHKNSENIYRLLSKDSFENQRSPETNLSITNKLSEEIPEILKTFSYGITSRKINDKIREKNIITASPEIIDILTFNCIEGTLESFKTDPKIVIISESIALKYFNKTEVIGKTLVLGSSGYIGNKPFSEKREFNIGAVFKDFTKKSSITPAMIIPIVNSLSYKNDMKSMTLASFQPLILLPDNIDIKSVVEKINKIGKEIDIKQGRGTVYSLQAIEDIHLYSDDIEEKHSGSIKKVLFYSIIGVLVLLISLLNFILLYVGITKRRFKEFAVRKAYGLTKLGLLKLFLFEALVISVLSSFIALFLMKLMIPLFNDFTNSELVFNFSNNYEFVLYGILLTSFIAMLSGVFFTLYMWRHNTVEVLSNNHSKKKFNFFINNGAVTVQVSIVSFMLIFLFGFYKQLDFMINSDKGYNSDNLITISMPESKIPFMKESLLKYPIIESVAFGHSLSDLNSSSMIVITNVEGTTGAVKFNYNDVDHNYIPLYNLKILKGRNFNKDYQGDEIILNEAAVKDLGIGDNPLGKHRFIMGEVIGVVQDFHFSSFHKTIEPYMLQRKKNNNENNLGFDFYKNITIKHIGGEGENAIQLIKSIMEKNISLFSLKFKPFDFNSLIEKIYDDEKKLQKAILAFTFLAILITVLGLIGMTLFKTEQKTKEIGIRKINGATIKEIMFMLNIDFIKWVLIAFVIACPIAYFAMAKWLENFAYKTSLSWWIFALAGLFTLVITLLTVSLQSWRAATRNPVEALRDE